MKFEVEDLLDVAQERQYETFSRLKVVRDLLDSVVTRAQTEWDLTPPSENGTVDDMVGVDATNGHTPSES